MSEASRRERLTSTQNPAVKYVRSLERSSVRREEGVYLIEGVRLVREAIDCGQHAALVLYDPDALNRSGAGSSLLSRLAFWADRACEASAHVLVAASQTEHPAGVVAVLRRVAPAPLSTHVDDAFGLILDRLGDPGNAGTILRTANAAGVGYVAALPGTVDLFSPKVVRAGMGAHFRLPIYTDVSLPEIESNLPGAQLVATDVRGGPSIYGYAWPAHTGLVIGGEAHGLAPEIDAAVTAKVHIPMRSGVESLNAAVAASIVMYTALGPGIAGPAERYR